MDDTTWIQQQDSESPLVPVSQPGILCRFLGTYACDVEFAEKTKDKYM